MTRYVFDTPDGCGYVEGSDTSREAAAKALKKAPAKRRRVAELVRAEGWAGLLARDVERLTGWIISTTSARVSEAAFWGLIIKTTRRRKTPSKCSAAVYVAPEFATPAELEGNRQFTLAVLSK